ncbi:NAD binding domain of 6-phosphogluconate dehydrogenase-domain-containing protein [Polychytrium aggregatum]|uniref:NAD binding domain of 6-phosphogluconate dehydrogenase-domain-containing protein n=1 Tax=Polychytrium aggregatum TaxID=110093 RepID=UPI0022FE900C|nr:NAD binding domain of 6-phosphogluconate dehydrogenase-domain-containing protein [Polychytrium aggregatum]KAI9193550.1 NAD binding domain of 6-phosphogluconate dehydrogenase-domain-containing protein [Polychytrium aggregatum]
MGYPMAANLHRKNPNAKFVINDVFQTATSRFVSENPDVTVASTPKELAEKCSVIVTMLPASAHVREVYLGENGVLKGLKNAIVIDSSTIDPRTTKEVAGAVNKAGSVGVDAPVSGGTLGAQAGTLTFMVGSESEEDFGKVKPILSHMGKNIVYCGPNGNGQVAKICNNMLLGISMIAASETMNLGVRLGMDPKLLAGILNTSTGRCWSTDTYNPCPGVLPNVPSSRDYEGGFGNSLMAKDLGLAITAANEAKSTVILGGMAHQIYNQVSSTPGFEKKDFSSVFKWLNDNIKKY